MTGKVGARPSPFEGKLEPEAKPCGTMTEAAAVSIAVSLKRMADMMEEARKPVLSLAPEGWVSDDEHRRIIREGLDKDNASLERIADALTTIAQPKASQ